MIDASFGGVVVRVLTISKPYVASAYRQKLSLLQDAGLTMGLICPPRWGQQQFESSPNDDSYWIKQLDIVFNGRNHFHFYRGLERAVREFKPDLVNCEEEHYSLVTWQCLKAAQSVRAKLLFYTWQNIAKTYPPPFSWTERAVFAAAAAGVVGNDEAAGVLRAKGYSGRIAEIPQMGVNLELFAPRDPSPAARQEKKARLKLGEAPFHVGFAGRMVEEKGLGTLLEAATHLPQIALVLLGDGPHLSALRTEAAARGISGRVQFLPQVPSTEVAQYLQAIDVLCLPSLTKANWKEQFGRILVEAMAAEAVVVGSSSGEIPRVIGPAGVIFTEGDAQSLQRVLAQLAADEQLCDHYRTAGRERVRAHYTNTVISSQWKELFNAVLAANPA